MDDTLRGLLFAAVVIVVVAVSYGVLYWLFRKQDSEASEDEVPR